MNTEKKTDSSDNITCQGMTLSVGVVETKILEISLPEEGFLLESGSSIAEVTVAYESYGDLNDDGSNVIFICHALTGDAHVAGYCSEDPASKGWWEEMVGPGKGIDTDHYHVICANILGGCSGTTGPSSKNPETGKPYGSAFPHFRVKDIVNLHHRFLTQLGIKKIAALIGASFGGMQAIEMALSYPQMIEHCVCIASAASLSAQALSFDIVGRTAITSDPNWNGGDYYDDGTVPGNGLALARKIGHITYLSPDMMMSKFGREKHGSVNIDSAAKETFLSDFEIESYLEHQGNKFVARFDANSYLYITKAMDEFDLADIYGSLDEAFSKIECKMLVVALTSDWLFPPSQSQLIANSLLRMGKHVSYATLCAPHGHDAFLVDVEHLSEMIRAFLPWVGPKYNIKSKITSIAKSNDSVMQENEYNSILNMMKPGSKVLDLGCGNGDLLSFLSDNSIGNGIGVDIDVQNIIEVIDKGYAVFQNDIDGGLAMIPDNTYDYAILGETLQVVHKPRLVMKEMLRVAKEGIVLFPNFGKWSHRLHLLKTGRMPKGTAIPFEWYDTPNIHPFTVRDFIDLCTEDNIRIKDMVCMTSGFIDSMFVRLGLCNAGANRILVKVASQSGPHKQCKINDER